MSTVKITHHACGHSVTMAYGHFRKAYPGFVGMLSRSPKSGEPRQADHHGLCHDCFVANMEAAKRARGE